MRWFLFFLVLGGLLWAYRSCAEKEQPEENKAATPTGVMPASSEKICFDKDREKIISELMGRKVYTSEEGSWEFVDRSEILAVSAISHGKGEGEFSRCAIALYMRDMNSGTFYYMGLILNYKKPNNEYILSSLTPLFYMDMDKAMSDEPRIPQREETSLEKIVNNYVEQTYRELQLIRLSSKECLAKGENNVENKWCAAQQEESVRFLVNRTYEKVHDFVAVEDKKSIEVAQEHWLEWMKQELIWYEISSTTCGPAHTQDLLYGASDFYEKRVLSLMSYLRDYAAKAQYCKKSLKQEQGEKKETPDKEKEI